MSDTEAPQSGGVLSAPGLLTLVLISVASGATAWCAYQSALWGGRQDFAILDASAENVRATEAHIEQNQRAMLDVVQYMAWLEADRRQDAGARDFFASTFRGELRSALDEWSASRQRDPAETPATPFGMPDYQRAIRAHGDALFERAGEITDRAMEYNRTSDTYGLMTVLLSMVSVIAGLAEKATHRRVGRAMYVLALVVLVGTLMRVATLPVTGVG